MKKINLLQIILLLIIPLTCFSADFNQYFENNTLRIDYYHIADSKTEIFTLDQMYKQKLWAGNPENMIDPFNNGIYLIKVIDLKTSKTIYSRGYNSYCGEYKTTAVAGKGIKRTYHETALIPFPKHKVKFCIEARDRKYNLHQVFTTVIDPESINIINEKVSGVEIFEILKNGDPSNKVDLVILAEGYSKNERDKVKKDFDRVKEMLFSEKPFSDFKQSFNMYGLYCSTLEDSGVDEPAKKVYKKTAVDSTFHSLGLSRYLLFESNKKLRNITGSVPCDSVIVMANSPRYGGGGIYNSFSIFTVDNTRAKFLLLHEFGHSFAGLADEYYSSDVAYEEFYPIGIEPLEPNITILLNKDLKWKKYIKKGTKIPTSWQKSKYDNLPKIYYKERTKVLKEIEQLKKQSKNKKITKKRKELEKLAKKYQKGMKDIFENKKLNNRVGAFQGAGYSSDNLYRPMIDCIMFSSRKNLYCRVCSASIIDMIKFYTGEKK